MAKAYGRAPGDRSTGSAAIQATCEEPLHRWELTIDTAARRVGREESRRQLVADGLPTVASARFTFEGAAPAYSPGAASWGRLHHDQPCRVRGALDYGEGAVTFEGVGYRDHSLGPRDLSGYRGSDWCQALFPGGRFLYLTDIRWEPAEHAMRRGFLFDGDDYQTVELKWMPSLAEAAVDPEAIQIGFLGPDGPNELTGTIENVVRFTHKLPHELCMGTDLDTVAASDLAVIDCMTRFAWDGEIGFGLCEWILPMREVPTIAFERW